MTVDEAVETFVSDSSSCSCGYYGCYTCAGRMLSDDRERLLSERQAFVEERDKLRFELANLRFCAKSVLPWIDCRSVQSGQMAYDNLYEALRPALSNSDQASLPMTPDPEKSK